MEQATWLIFLVTVTKVDNSSAQHTIRSSDLGVKQSTQELQASTSDHHHDTRISSLTKSGNKVQ